jgi:hypothetical protein
MEFVLGLSRPQIAFTMGPILIHPDFSKPLFLESDASDYILSIIFYFKIEAMNNFTQLYFIHESL